MYRFLEKHFFHALANGIKANGDHATQDQPPVGLARRDQGTTCASLFGKLFSASLDIKWLDSSERTPCFFCPVRSGQLDTTPRSWPPNLSL